MGELDNSRIGGRIRGNSHGPPLKNIHGDVHNIIEEEDILIGLNQQMPRMPSEDSILDFEEEERHHALPHGH